ncbi:hypothetical protein CTAYLR_006207 [Chrysophaeum taylorii]|uniref:Vms1-associating treble clef domain-containing protein n=1 Tax=Chrysophaeum taylorii TaxID=2483200 RepID=A0AAD7U6W8_9STRA|nr:hypothetical protein CTAYLR_006207 [Chrysophaeum taylorii]
MIKTLTGPVKASEVSLVAFEHVLCDGACEWGGDDEVSRGNAALDGRVRLEPWKYETALDSFEIAARELAALKKGEVVCDVTTVDEGRDVVGLERIARTVEARVCYGASTSSDCADVERTLRGELGGKAAFITVRWPASPAVAEGVAAASRATGALVVVSLPGENPESHARAAVAAFGEDRVVLRCAWRVDPARLAAVALFVVDGFGRPFEAAFHGIPDSSDAERIRSLKETPGVRERVAGSVGVRHRHQLKTYGGLGYDYARELLTRHGCADVLRNERVLSLLATYEAPLMIKPPETQKLQCSLCGRVFEVPLGQHYAKYDFVYCTRACLARHRRDHAFASDVLQGPRASEQGM